jgi:NAD(P)-dependent dehydrogenase (short-subunit alcohol dehydrogenase family)
METTMDKVAIITGASRGIGRNTAINLARRNVDVIFTYRANQACMSLLSFAVVRARKSGSNAIPNPIVAKTFSISGSSALILPFGLIRNSLRPADNTTVLDRDFANTRNW